MDSSQKLIMLPGPTNVSERVMLAMQGPIINHRGDTFRELYKGLLEKVRHLFQTQGDVVVFSSSGTGGVEAAVWNLIRPGDVAVVPVFGEFSARLAETVEMAGGTALRVTASPGNSPDFDAVRAAAMQVKSLKAIFLVHNETSMGVAANYVEEVAKLAADRGAFSVIDAISSLGGYAIPVDQWGIDVCITGSQKCIAAPPGLALLSTSKKFLDFLKTSPPKTRYFEIPRYLEYGTRGETPFTPALPLFYALDEALKELLEEGLSNRVARHDHMSALLYDGLAKINFAPLADKGVRSKTVIASRYPQGVDDVKFRSKLEDEHGIIIAGGFGQFKGKVCRVGCMGQINQGFVDRTLGAMGETLSTFENS